MGACVELVLPDSVVFEDSAIFLSCAAVRCCAHTFVHTSFNNAAGAFRGVRTMVGKILRRQAAASLEKN